MNFHSVNLRGSRPTLQRLAFVIPNMTVGGAARVASILCAEWVAAGHEVHLVTYEDPGTPPIYPIDPSVVRHQIGLSVSPENMFGFVSNNAQRVFRLRRALKKIKPTAVISFLLNANITAVVAGRSLGIPVIISDRNHPGHDKISSVREKVREFIYPFASRVCVQTENIRSWYGENLKLDTVVIPNPAPSPDCRPVTVHAAQSIRRLRAISLGRLVYQKGLDRLIDAFALISAEAAQWDLAIYGVGEAREDLEKQIEARGLRERVFLMGNTTDAMRELRESDLYVHAARYEGYPNAILEALAAGLCVVATDCPGATSEILDRGKYGILVPDADADCLAEGMKKAMIDDVVRERFATLAPKAIENITPDAIAQRWVREVEQCQKVAV